MAIIAQDTLNGKLLLEVDSDPTLTTGAAAPLGSVSLWNTGTTGKMFIKTGATDTGWSPFTSSNDTSYGQYFQEANSLALSTTTSTAVYVNKLTLTTPAIPIGKYRIGWAYEWGYTDNANGFLGRVQLDTLTNLMTQQQDPHDGATDQRQPAAGFAYVSFIVAAAHSITIDFARDAGTGTARIQNARLEIWRVSD